MSTFKVGEIAIGQNIAWSAYNETECQIVGALEDRVVLNAVTFQRETWLGYRVRWCDGFISVQYPRQLRKRPAPSAEDVAMLDCIERAKRGMEIPA